MTMGKPLPHDSAALHVTGAARYVDDIPAPANALHLAFGLSGVACGRITAIELDAVRAAPGVVAVLTHTDLPPDLDISHSHVGDEPLLAKGAVHHVGQPVFLVAADSHLAARKAAQLGRISYDEQVPILTIDEALAANSRFEEGPRLYRKGDPEAAIAASPIVIAGRIEIGGQEHFYLEGQVALALPQDNGDMVVHSSTQNPTEIQHMVAQALGKPMHAVRVEVRRMGGGFGGKESQGNPLAVACALVAARTGRPCKMRYDRDDDMLITGKRHDFRITYRVGVDGQGRINGIVFHHYARCGWTEDLSLPVCDRAMLHADNAYHLPAVTIESHRLRTNSQSATAFRGFGGPQGLLGIERVLDHVAHRVGRDPLAVRRLNFYEDMLEKPGGFPPPGPPEDISEQKMGEEGEKQTTPYHMPVEDFILHRLVARLEASSGYQARRAVVAAWNEANPVLKRGLALTPVKFGISFTLSMLNQAGSLVHVYQDGSIALNHGGTEMGQGLFQKVAQVAASGFGVEVGRVRITATDTGKVPNTSATAASSGSDLNGMAVADAVARIRARLAVHVAGDQAAQVRFEAGRVLYPGFERSFDEVVASAWRARVSLSATGFYATPGLEWNRIEGRGRPFFYFAYGAAVSEVVVDVLTGENRILRCDILHDVGQSLNPALDIGQIEGGYVQGAGWLTTEELVWDAKGYLTTHAPSTYKIPACSDRPRIFNLDLWQGANPADTIYRSKAVGEPPLMLGISAFLAISDAVAACGDGSVYPGLDAPATPERVLWAIRRQRGAGHEL